MSERVRNAYMQEMTAATLARQRGELDLAFQHLERAHVLSQRLTWLHVRTHLAMWRIGWLRRDLREMFGQSTRSIAALLFSRIWVPIGNTGGANVNALKPMPLSDDLREILESPNQ